MRPTARPRQSEPRRGLPHAALLLLAALLSSVTAFLTWPTRHIVTCESLPQLAALALCAAVLIILCVRAAATAHLAAREAVQTPSQDVRVAGGAAILALLALFLAVHYITVYRAPCAAVQHQLKPR